VIVLSRRWGPGGDVVGDDPGRRIAVVARLVALYSLGFCVLRLPHLWDLADHHPARWHPVGVLAPFDTPPATGLWRLTLVLTIAAAALVVLDRARGVALPALAAGMLVVATYRSSWGQLFHTEHLVVLHLLVLAAGDAVRRWRDDPALVVRALAIVTAATYVVSGVAKLRTGGLDWLAGDALRHQIAFDNVRKELFDSAASPLAGPLVARPWLFPPLAAMTLAVELGAPLALLGRRWAAAWAAAAWLFHLGVLAGMAIVFAYPLSGVAFAPLLPVERLRLRRRRRPQRRDRDTRATYR
jgi:hypothetical protein